MSYIHVYVSQSRDMLSQVNESHWTTYWSPFYTMKRLVVEGVDILLLLSWGNPIITFNVSLFKHFESRTSSVSYLLSTIKKMFRINPIVILRVNLVE